jgi:hypothetical protein
MRKPSHAQPTCPTLPTEYKMRFDVHVFKTKKSTTPIRHFGVYLSTRPLVGDFLAVVDPKSGETFKVFRVVFLYTTPDTDLSAFEVREGDLHVIAKRIHLDERASS